jgi:hypothetical protein
MVCMHRQYPTACAVKPMAAALLAATVICFAVFRQTDALIWAPASTLAHSTIARVILLYDQCVETIADVRGPFTWRGPNSSVRSIATSGVPCRTFS